MKGILRSNGWDLVCREKKLLKKKNKRESAFIFPYFFFFFQIMFDWHLVTPLLVSKTQKGKKNFHSLENIKKLLEVLFFLLKKEYSKEYYFKIFLF